ncbi:protein-methionine sulfoxide oxidase mical3-like [Dermatophagoides farinae]|uniref:Protein-methionine sulfoxide oxidase mical3-like n=1 Tax=Dermatophagoides farinae TaxID=6954 RepID=A0A9D4SIT7_DERFA|nr:protein-methionine sulfoxide oxidase mical3-like [Dermatophagoides farinae]
MERSPKSNTTTTPPPPTTTTTTTMNSNGKNSTLHDDDDDHNDRIMNLMESTSNDEQQQQQQLYTMVQQIVQDSVHNACMELLLEQQQQQQSSDSDVDDDDDDADAAKKNNKKRNNHNRKQRPATATATSTTTTTTTATKTDATKISESTTSKKQSSSLSKSKKSAVVVDNKIKQESIDEQQQQQLKQEFEKENIELITEPVVNGQLNVDDKNNGEEKQDSNFVKCSLDSSSDNTNSNDNKMNGVKSYGSNHMNGVCIGGESTICKICSKHVYHMEQIKAVKSIFHKSCFRCIECNKQLNMDSYSSHEGQIYCKPHFKQLFQPKPNFDNNHMNGNHNNHNGIIDIDIVDHSSTRTTNDYYNSKQQDVFENLTLDLSNIRNRFETGSVSNNNNNRINNSNIKAVLLVIIVLVSSSDDEDNNNQRQQQQQNVNDETTMTLNNENGDNNNNNLKEKMSFTGMSTLKSQWETGSIANKQGDNRSVENELAELRRVKGKNSEPLTKMYERAIQEAQSMENLSTHKSEPLLVDGCSMRAGSIKEKFEKGAVESTETEEDRMERLRKEREAEIIQIANNDRALKEARNKFKQIELGQQIDNGGNNNTDNNNGHIESIDSKQLQQRFNYFENRNDADIIDGTVGSNGDDGQPQQQHSSVKIVDDIPKVDTTKKMLSKFKALEAGQITGSSNGDQSSSSSSSLISNGSPKMFKCITPPRETMKVYENEPMVEHNPNIVKSSYKTEDVIQVEPEKAKHLRAKFENWQTEIERENRKQDDENDFVPLERDTTKNLRAMFESIQNETNKPIDKPRPRVNRFVQEKTYQQQTDSCYVCSTRIYPMEKMEFSGIKLHKNCFRCAKCHMPMRLDNFTQHADKLFCIPHFKQLFMEKGNYDEGFGLEQHKDKWSNKTNGGKSSTIATTVTVATNGKSANGHHHHQDHDNVLDQLDGELNGHNNNKTNGHNGNNLINIDSDDQLDSSIEYDYQQQQQRQQQDHAELIEDY